MKERAGWLIISISGVHKFEFNSGKHNAENAFTDVLREGLPKADSLATEERPVRHGMSALAVRCKIVRGLWVESLRQETLWCNPLGGVVLESMDVNYEPLPIQNIVWANLAGTSHLMNGAKS